jgi:hypothetical protein
LTSKGYEKQGQKLKRITLSAKKLSSIRIQLPLTINKIPAGTKFPCGSIADKPCMKTLN